jgi:hypothetical protein
VTFGEPIPPSRFREDYEKDAAEAAHLLSDALGQAIARLVVDIERPEFEDLVRGVESVYKEELLLRERSAERGGSRTELDHLVSVGIPRVLDFFLERRPEVVWRVRRLLNDYLGALDRARVRDEMLRDAKDKSLGGAIARLAGFGVVGLPLAFWGTIWNFVPYKFTGFLAHGAAKDETKIHYHQIVYGAILFPLWYAPAVYLANRILGAWGMAVFAASLPVSGLFALGYIRAFTRRRRLVRFFLLRVTRGRFVQELESKRRLLIGEMDVALAEYLGAQLDAELDTYDMGKGHRE